MDAGLRAPRSRRRLVAVATLVVWSLLGAAWWVLGFNEEQRARALTQRDADQAAVRLSDFVAARLVAVDSIRRIREAGLLDDEAAFVRSCTIVQRELTGFLAINWIDSDGVIRWVSPPTPNERARGKNVFEHPQAAPAAQRAKAEHRPAITPPLPLFQGTLGFATYYPVLVEGELRGFINGVFDIRGLVERSLAEGVLEDHELSITTHDGLPVYETPSFAPAARARPVGTKELEVLGARWRLSLVQNDESATSSPARHVLFWVGSLLILACALLVDRGLARRQEQRQLEREQRELAELVAASPDIHALLDREGRAVRTNTAARRWVSEGAAFGDHVGDREAFDEALGRAFAGEPQRMMVDFGPEHWPYDVTLAPLRDDLGAVALHAKDDR
ncbi:MAG: CHASE domain-containing protein, partial [Myxococcales bacterium]|nr:CHASE domain-containing protein [Myxococcales bacterium]